jgi:HEAT repeat protein
MLSDEHKGNIMRMVRYLTAAVLVLAASATLVWAQTNSQEIMARPAAALVELIKNPNAPVFEKAKACQRLAVIGTKDAVPALAALLPDEHLNLYARFGLEGILDPSVDTVLRDAAAKLQGSQLIGVLDSIGQRKDAQAVGLLKGFLKHSDVAVASAAAGALGRIGTTDAAAALNEALAQDSPIKNWIADACLACADGLVAGGKKPEAVALLETVAKADLPKHIKVAALCGQLQIQQGAAKDLLLAQIRNPDKAYFNVGVAVARVMPGAEVTTALVAELDKLPAERQALLLRALADRKDSTPMPAVLAATKSESPAVRQAAIYVLAKHGDASAAPVLLDAALGDAEVAQAAKDGLKTLAGQEVDAAILARLAGADAKAKVVLFDLLAARRIAAATPSIRQALSDANEPVRIAAITALGRLADLGDVDLLSGKALAGTSPAEKGAAQVSLRMAILRMSDRDACAAKLAARLGGAPIEQQTYLLELLGKLSGPKALEIVVANAKSSNPAVKDAASRVLGNWPNAEAAPVLLDIVKTDADSKYQIRALRGYIRIARQLQLPAETKLAMFRTAMDSAKRSQEKQVAMEILSRIPSAETLALAVSYLGDAALKDQAADVSVKIGTKIVGRDPKAVAAAMQKVVDANAPAAVAAHAKQLLGQAQTAAK